jgi:hypothetical protein
MYDAWHDHLQIRRGAVTDKAGSFYFGNAAVDQVRGTGWFGGQFVAVRGDFCPKPDRRRLR